MRCCLLDRRELIIPPCYGLAQNITNIIAFPWAVEKRPVDVLSNFRYLSEPHGVTLAHRLRGEFNREGHLCQRVNIAAVFLEQVVTLPFNKFTEDFVLGVRALPLPECGTSGPLYNRILAIHLVENVADCPDQGDGCRPVNAPSLNAGFIFQQRQRYTAIIEELRGPWRSRLSILRTETRFQLLHNADQDG